MPFFMRFDTCLSLVILGSKVNVYTLSLCILKKVTPEFFLFYIPNFDHINIFVLTEKVKTVFGLKYRKKHVSPNPTVTPKSN